MSFLKQFISNPLKTWAVSPSWKTLAHYIVKYAELIWKKCIIEFGSWTWIFTEEINRVKEKDSLFFSLEINKYFVETTLKKCPNSIVYHDDILNLPSYFKKHNISECDCIISWLPWASFNQENQNIFMDITYNALSEKWVFLTFTYIQSPLLASWKKFEKLLNKKFKNIEKSKIIWKNIPPAFIYICKK